MSFWCIFMVLIDFLNKTIPGGGQKKIFSASREILPPWLKSCVRACKICMFIVFLDTSVHLCPPGEHFRELGGGIFRNNEHGNYSGSEWWMTTQFRPKIRIPT